MRGGAWLRLLSYCVALVLAVSLVMAALLASASLAFGFGREKASESQDSSSPVTVSGVITDSHCGAKHATDSGKGPAECARICVRRGAHYVVVNGDTTYFLEGSQTTFDAFAGQRTRVSGTLEGNTLRVASIRAP